MADDSPLDYIKTFVDEATTSLAVETYESQKDINQISGAKKCLVFPGEMITSNYKFYTTRHLIKLSLENEANLFSIIDEIIVGCRNFNRRASGFTYPAPMCNIEPIYSRKGFITVNGRWDIDLYLDIEWSAE